MAFVSLQDVHLSFGSQILFEELDWQIQRGEKVGLVGINGSGKTSLFKLILGELNPQIGGVTRARGLQIAYLPQEPVLDTSNTLFAEVCTTFEKVQRLEERVAEVAQRIADHHDSDRLDDLMAEYDEMEHRLEAAGGYKYEVVVKEILGGLGFLPEHYDLPISVLSGGQKCRAALAQLLLQEADLLLLDEPTNHLDIEATEFLEGFLADYHGAAIVVSHDRYLLDRAVTKIVDLDQRRVTVYPCSYSDYAESKQVRQITAEREFEKQQVWIKHQREYAQRVKADKSRAKQARGRLRYLARMERDGKVLAQPVRMQRKMALDFTPAQQGGDLVLRCEGVCKAYGEVVLFEGFDLEIYRGEKIGIIGPNGVGKSTLLKMAMDRIKPDVGEVRLVGNLDVGYYDQEHADLNLENTVLDEIEPDRSAPQEQALRSFMARFLFRGNEVYKRVGDLSGGEQSRVTLAKLVWSKPQVLVLDEPTNHLDIPGKEVLEEALIDFEGAILLISHDRYFLDRVVNKLLVLPERGKYELLVGNWSAYEQRLAEREAARLAELERAKVEARRRRKLQAKKSTAAVESTDDSPYASWSLTKLEDAIIEREDRLARINERFADPNIYRDADQARSLRGEADQLRAELTDLNEAWETRSI